MLRGGLQVLTALQFAPPLAVRGGWHADVHHVVSRGLVMGRPLSNLFLRDDAVDFWFDKRMGGGTGQLIPAKILLLCYCFTFKNELAASPFKLRWHV